MSAAKWEVGACRVFGPRTSDEGAMWLAWTSPKAPGLAVTQVAGSQPTIFTVTHVASGYAASRGYGFDTLEQAQEALRALAKFADWTLPIDVLRATPGLRERVDVTLATLATVWWGS